MDERADQISELVLVILGLGGEADALVERPKGKMFPDKKQSAC